MRLPSRSQRPLSYSSSVFYTFTQFRPSKRYFERLYGERASTLSFTFSVAEYSGIQNGFPLSYLQNIAFIDSFYLTLACNWLVIHFNYSTSHEKVSNKCGHNRFLALSSASHLFASCYQRFIVNFVEIAPAE